MPEREPVVGIDLGTTNSVVATVQDGQAVVIKNRAGNNLTPSMLAVTKSGKRLVGQIAKRQAVTNPEDTVYASKRLIGRKYSTERVQEYLKTLSYGVVCGDHDDIRVVLGGREVTLPEISGAILRELKLDAEAHFGQPVTKAVITVPAYFNDGQRQATKDAGKIAGLDVLRIINEPTAAALAYGFGRNVSGKIAVFDLGGGTFDISVLEISKGIFDVAATGGDTLLGGEDFDNRVIESLVFGFAKDHGIDLRKDRMALQRLKDAAEKAKIELSGTQEVQINLPFICTPPGGGSALHLQRTLTRAKLEELTEDLSEKTITIADQVLSEAKVRPDQLREVILVGGMTRMPRVVEKVKKYFRREPSKGVHPEEVVALGAAVQAHALTSQESQVLLLDVTPQSLGTAIAGGYTRRLIPRNTTVPTSTAELFTTSRDCQTTVKIMVLQGESEIARENELLGEFVLSGLREASRGEVEIEVTFEINAEGIVSASARDKETGQQQSITLTATGRLTPEELAKILESQNEYLMEDRELEELHSKKQKLEASIREVQDLLPKVKKIITTSEFGSDALKRVDETLRIGMEALKGRSLAAIVQSTDQLSRTLNMFRGVIQKIGSPDP
jgi:molecular chaperone DnaK